jgi:hypothetical protein
VFSSAATAEEALQPYANVLELCRALAAATPLPVVCNNHGCESFDAVSEAAAANNFFLSSFFFF